MGGKNHGYESARLRFVSREIASDLINLGFLEFKTDRLGLPPCVKKQTKKVYELTRKNNTLWYHNIYGKYVCAFLLGFIDADGSLYRRKYKQKTYYSVNITNTNRKLLEDIKKFFNINNKIYLHKDPKDYSANNKHIKSRKKCFTLYIPPSFYKDGLMTIKELEDISFPRKRIKL